MNWPAVRTVFFKEMREFLRDRRALFVGVVLPILLYPVLTVFMTLMVGSQISKLTSEKYEIGVSPPERLQEVESWYRQKCDEEMAALQALSVPPVPPPGADPAAPAATPPEPNVEGQFMPFARSFNLIFVPVAESAATQMLQEKKVKAVILFRPPGAADLAGAPEPAVRKVDDSEPDISILKESADIRSRTAATYVYNLLEYHRDKLVRAKLLALGGDPDKLLQPFRIDTQQDLSSKEEKGGALFGGILPFMLVIMLIGAASYPAIDVTTGERERGTMETLLIAPVKARDLVAGKFLAVFSLACAACFFNVLSLGFSMYFGGMGIAEKLELAIPWTALPWVLILLLPLAILFSALLMLAGSFAASTKEAQTYLSPVIMLAMFPSMLALVPGIELNGGWLFLPIGNVTLLSRDLLSGQVKFPEGLSTIAVVLGSTWLYTLSVVGLAGSLFGREEVLYGEKPWRVLLDRQRLKPRPTPSGSEALFIAACALPLFIYASMIFDKLLTAAGHLWANVPAQIGAILLWPMLYAWRSRSHLRHTFALRAPERPLQLAGLPFLIVGGYLLATLVATFTELFMPPDFAAEQMNQILQAEVARWPLPVMLFLIAVVPAICEELLFRGFLQQSLLKSIGPRWAILIQALAFAIFHTSLNRLPYTFVLGLLLGVLAWRSASVLPGILVHFVVNGISTVLAYHPDSAVGQLLNTAFSAGMIPYTAGVSIILTEIGIAFLYLFRHPAASPPLTPAPVPPA